uniref:Putative retrotransposon protein n=1 Tax=Phyllostachys edulis TaxID=38705 RepID=D3IVI4_PHYED|nr:putative retrotransposon protein [Phyllostachys edulis]
MATSTVLDPDEDGEAVDQREYCSMIDSLLYLMASRPDIHFAICLCMVSTIKDFGLNFASVPLLCDNTSAINVAKNLVQHSKTKHIDIRYHFLRNHVEKGDIVVEFVESDAQLADILTKPLDPTRFATLRSELGAF